LFMRAYDAPVSSVNVPDTLPPNWAYVAGSTIITLPGGGTVSGPPAEPAVAGQTLGWNLGLSLVPGEELIIRFTAVTTAAPGGDSVNEASATGTDSNGDPVSDTTTATVATSALLVEKVADVAVAQPGDTITYTVTVTNAGTARQTGITVTDPLPAGL